MEATPRPWRLVGSTIRGANGEMVGLMMDVSNQTPTDTELAIRAVNTHDRLIEALEVFIGDYDAGMEFDAGELRTHYREMKAALALARGEVE